MGFKKRNKINAEFSMSSLTDIIFLLLIFFMLTATFVKVDAVDLPEADTQSVAAMGTTVTIEKDGSLILNGSKIPMSGLKRALSIELKKTTETDNPAIGIAPDKKTKVKVIKRVIKIAKELKKDVILLTKPSEG